MTGLAQLDSLILEMRARHVLQVELSSAKSLSEVLDILSLLTGWIERERQIVKKERLRASLHRLGWLDPEMLMTASPEALQIGVREIVQVVLE